MVDGAPSSRPEQPVASPIVPVMRNESDGTPFCCRMNAAKDTAMAERRETSARKTSTRKTAAKKSTARKASTRKTTARKAAPKKAAGKKRATGMTARHSTGKPATGSATRWSQQVTETSDALDLKNGVFKLQDPKKIAASLKNSAEHSARRKTGAYRSALSMLTFYINRAGKNLPKA